MMPSQRWRREKDDDDMTNICGHSHINDFRKWNDYIPPSAFEITGFRLYQCSYCKRWISVIGEPRKYNDREILNVLQSAIKAEMN